MDQRELSERGRKMSSDDLTHNLSDSNEDDKATQPTITAVFRLLQDLDKRLNGRFAVVETRLGALETRLGALETRLGALETRLGALETRLGALENEMKTGFIQLGDKLADEMDRTRLHADADREDLLRRIRRLESKAS
jgi:chromosome segregation ATPase